MRTSILAVALLLAPLASQRLAIAQEAPKSDGPEATKAVKPEQHFYRLNFVVQDLDESGKPMNSRSYTTTISTETSAAAQIRTGARIPVPIGPMDSNGKTSQFQYFESGINIDLRNAHDIGQKLTFELKADVSSVPPTSDTNLSGRITRQNQWVAQVLIPIGKATPIFTSDSVDSKGSMQVVVTATPLQ